MAALLAALVLVTGATGQAASRSSLGPRAHPSGTITFAQPAGETINCIFPLFTTVCDTALNTGEFQPLMYRLLYWFAGGGQPVFLPGNSLAYAPVYSNRGRTVTIRLRDWRWSDGVPVTSRDVQFWEDLLVQEKRNYGAYAPGEYPDDVTSFRIVNAKTFTMTFNRAYNQQWLLRNQLSLITPLPQHAWDRTSAHGPVGNYDRTPSGARAVYKFLIGQADSLSTWQSNPLWQVVDGPWRLTSYIPSTGYTALKPNPHYSGVQPARAAEFVELPFTSDTAELDALRSGAVDVGYLPLEDVRLQKEFNSLGYRAAPWVAYQTSWISLNFTNPTTRALIQQRYLRQAMQELINEPQWIRDIYHGYAYEVTGPAPSHPGGTFTAPGERSAPYPYAPRRALMLLSRHGWHVVRNGTSTCARPGSGPGECGAGITLHQPLVFTAWNSTGSPIYTEQSEALQSSFSQVGIRVNLRFAPANDVFAITEPCSKTSACRWDMGFFSWVYGDDSYPSGEEIFQAGAPTNVGAYNDPVNNANIRRSLLAGHGLSGLYTYEDYMARQVPVLWIPNSVFQITEIKRGVHGVVPQPTTDYLAPEDWSISP